MKHNYLLKSLVIIANVWIESFKCTLASLALNVNYNEVVKSIIIIMGWHAADSIHLTLESQ